MREPDFENLLRVMRRERPTRPTLFEFAFHQGIARQVAGDAFTEKGDGLDGCRLLIHAFRALGYDYVKIAGSDFRFPKGELDRLRTRSLNQGVLITDRETFLDYPWPDPDAVEYSRLERLAPELPDGMRIVIHSPGGVLENVCQLVGFDNLCFMVMDDPDLAQDVFDAVGTRLLRYFELCLAFDAVGAICSNDDWGFRQQTMLRPEDMRRYVFPWHKRIVVAAHAAGRPALLHSCGNLDRVMDDVIDDMRFDAKHSFEDVILPVEEAYERWADRIAILGGIDVDFICQSSADAVYRRSKAMLERAQDRGAYALGTGNSVPDYVPTENFLAMVRAATEVESY